MSLKETTAEAFLCLVHLLFSVLISLLEVCSRFPVPLIDLTNVCECLLFNKITYAGQFLHKSNVESLIFVYHGGYNCLVIHVWSLVQFLAST